MELNRECRRHVRANDLDALRHTLCSNSHKEQVDEWVCATAAEEGHVKIVRFLAKNNCAVTPIACAWAARKGHLPIVQFLVQHGSIDERACQWACQYGQKKIVEWFLKHAKLHIPSNIGVCIAQHNQLDMLHLLVEHRVEFTSKMLEVAAYNGHMKMVQQLALLNCPYSMWCMWNAFSQGYWEVGWYIVEKKSC